MNTPTKVRIGAQIYSIEEREKKQDALLSEDNYGYTLDTGNLIVLDRAMALSKKQQVLVHEIMHAMRMVFEGAIRPPEKSTYDTWEHYFIGLWEPTILMFVKDNPLVVEWLAWDGENGTP
jgi:hypothetical protein